MTTEATQQGVSRQEQDREALIAKRAKERSIELNEPKPEEEPALEAEAEAEPEPEIEVESEVKPDPEAKEELDTNATPDQIQKPEMVQFTDDQGTVYEVPASAAARLKIDGKEVETPLKTAFSRYQKGAAGDKRLQEASNIKQELEAKTQALTLREQAFLNQVQEVQAKKAQGNLSNDEYTRKIKDLAGALVEADEERAAELFQQVLPKEIPQSQPIGLKPADVDARVAQQFEEYMKQQDLKKAQADFYDNYSDLAEDPMLFEMVDTKTAKLSGENPDLPPSEIIKKAAEEVKQWWQGQFKKTKPKRKKNTSPTPASGRAKIGEEEAAPETRKEILSTMRQARGQPATY